VSFIILVPAGMAADAARKTQAVVNSIQVRQPHLLCSHPGGIEGP
jgi:hypothetical protein